MKWVENKDVVFTCQRDIYEYLLADKGNAVRGRISGITIYFEDGDLLPFNYFGNFKIINDWVPMKRAEWYDDIPEKGVIGKAYSGHSEKYVICLCIGYDHDKECPFISQHKFGYKNFIPFTKEEVIQYILPD